MTELRAKRMGSFNRFLSIAAAVLVSCVARGAIAENTLLDFAIPREKASDSLRAFSNTAGVQLLFDMDAVGDVTTRPVKGRFTWREALEHLLHRTPLTFQLLSDNTVIVKRAPKAAPLPDRRELSQINSSEGRDSYETLTDVLVTTRRLSQPIPSGTTLQSLFAQDAQYQSIVTTPDLTKTVPQIFRGGPGENTILGPEAKTNNQRGTAINMRGLGARNTLILVDGLHVAMGGTAGWFVDVASFPLQAFDRTEILPYNVSAWYGAEAVGGVVNFVPRRDLQGVEVGAIGGNASGNALRERELYAIGGTHDTLHNFTLFFDYYQRGSLPASRRALATSDLAPWGGGNFDTVNGNPGTIAMDGNSWAIPTGQNGRALTPNQLLAGAENRYDRYAGADILPSEQRMSVLGTLHRGSMEGLSFTLDTFLADRRVESRYNSQPVTLLVPSINPYYVNPTGGTGAVPVAYDLRKDLGPLTSTVDVQTAVAALMFAMPLSPGWFLSDTISGAAEIQRQTWMNAANSAALAVALDDPDPETAFDAFGDGSYTSVATLEKLRHRENSRISSYTVVDSIRLAGPLASLRGGDLMFATGFELRDEILKGDHMRAAGESPIAGYLGRRITDTYCELTAPLAGARSSKLGLNELKLSIAARYEHYFDVAGFVSPFVGLDWSPTSRLTLQATWTRSYRPPDMPDLVNWGNSGQATVLPDSRSATGFSTALLWSGGNPNLRPERAQSSTFGLSLNPFPDFSFALTYFNIKLMDRIVQPSAGSNILNDPQAQSVIVSHMTDAQRKDVCNDITYGNVQNCTQSGIDILVDDRERNLATLLTRGLDFAAKYEWQPRMGKLTLNLNGTYILKYAQSVTPQSAVTEMRNTQNNPLSVQLRSTASWDFHHFGATASLNYAGAYRDVDSVPVRRVRPWATTDVQIRYSFTTSFPTWCQAQVSLSARNLFNQSPPFLNNQLANIGYDQENADLSGRVLRLGLRLAF